MPTLDLLLQVLTSRSILPLPFYLLEPGLFALIE